MQILDIKTELKGNSYPGRSIIIGKSEDGKSVVVAYFIMGRSVNSRNRVFVEDTNGLRTQAHDPKLLSDPSLVIYAPVRIFEDKLIVTNGDQTDTVYDFLAKGKTFEDALYTRTFEPDGPIFTPRISGLVSCTGGEVNYKLSILKSCEGNEALAERQFFNYTGYNGMGHFIHTYKCDGNPRIPSFEGEPKRVNISGSIDEYTNDIWTSLDEDNKVSLFVRYIDIATGESETRIVNKNS